MRRSPALFPSLLAVWALACGTDPDSINTDFDRDNKFAQARVFALVPQPAEYTAFVVTGEELPVTFSFGSNTLLSGFKQQVIGEWTGYATRQTATVATAKTTVAEGERWLAVLASSAAPGGEGPLTLQWSKEELTPGSQARVRFVAGASGFSDATVRVGSSALTGSHALGVVSAFQDVAPGAASIEVTPAGGSPLTFPGATFAAGELWTIGLVAEGDSSLKLVLFKEGAAGTETQNPTE